MKYSKDEQILIWLSSFSSLTLNKLHTLLEAYNKPQKLFEAIQKKESLAQKILGIHFSELFENAEEEQIKSYINNLEKLSIECLTYLSADYPEKLKGIYQFPVVLYVKGDKTLLNKKSVGIVGSRSPSSYGKTITHDFSKALAKAGLVIVSGLAMGVDRVAHQACLEIGGKTIAVIGSGFLNIYPAMNSSLAHEIEKQGLLLSEYPPNATPTKFNFPARNRIIAGLSDGVLITEAGEKSGALYTKEFALEYGKSVYAVPGNINSILSKGTNSIIKHLQGAIVLDYKDILLDLDVEEVKSEKVLQLNVNEALIISFVEKEQIHFENLARLTQLDAKTLNSCLTSLSIRGIIKKLPGNFYSN